MFERSNKIFFIVSTALLFTIIVVIFSFYSFQKRVNQDFEKILLAQEESTIFYDQAGEPFHTIQGTEGRRYMPLGKISIHLLKSVVAIEDARFFKHFGFDPIRIIKAILIYITPGKPIHGASTITQQLLKLSLLTSERTFIRKIKEVLMAPALEMRYSKEKILEFYLNRIYFGRGNYGIENAAQNYFHKKAADLTLAESAILAGIIKKPEGYSPFHQIKKTRSRQELVLTRLRDLNWITEREKTDALQEKIRIKQPKTFLRAAPHFVNHILLQLIHRYGSKKIYGGGLRVYTTLDSRLQKRLDEVIDDQAYQSNNFNEIAAVSLEPSTGFVKALVGGIDFWESEFNRATQAQRQPGSSFKAILYASALENGINSEDIYQDEPTIYTNEDFIESDSELEIYEPQNYNGEHYGPISVGYALQVSNNVVSVKILDEIGETKLRRTARKFGLELGRGQGLCLALGCSEVTLLNLTSAYSTFPNNGLREKPTFILKVTDSQGKVLESFIPEPTKFVLDSEINAKMHELLQNALRYGTGKNADIGGDIGGKTGTNDNFRDAWFIGYTPNLATGFWIGNDDNTPMDNEFGGGTPAKLWKKYMQRVRAITSQ